MTGQMKAGLLGLGLAAAVLAGVALVQGGNPDQKSIGQRDELIFEWTPPTTGTAVVKYEVKVRTNGDDETIQHQFVTTNRVSIPVNDDDSLAEYDVQVRGIDAKNAAGPWSDWSKAEDRDYGDPDF